MLAESKGGWPSAWRGQAGVPWEPTIHLCLCGEHHFHALAVGLCGLQAPGTRHLLNKKAPDSSSRRIWPGEGPPARALEPSRLGAARSCAPEAAPPGRCGGEQAAQPSSLNFLESWCFAVKLGP